MNKKSFTKLTVMAIIAVFTFAAIPQNTFAQLSKKQEKALTKKAKATAKQWEKQGWEISGSVNSLEDALFDFYSKQATDNAQFKVGAVSQCRSINVCRKNALFNAQTDYVQEISQEIKGIADEVVNNNPSLKLETDGFSGTFVGKMKADVSGILIESFSRVREKDGVKEFETYFIINKLKEGTARTSALEQALKETQLTVDQIDTVSKFIDDKFKEDDDVKSKAVESDLNSDSDDD